MKKIAIFLFIVILIVAGISYMYINYNANLQKAQMENKQFESYKGKKILGTDITTVINKAIDSNKINKVEQDQKGYYINNNTNSINIDIKMIDNDKTYSMETLYKGGMEKFIQFYSEIEFICTKMEYHQSTGKIKYMLFEQITQ